LPRFLVDEIEIATTDLADEAPSGTAYKVGFLDTVRIYCINNVFRVHLFDAQRDAPPSGGAERFCSKSAPSAAV
jgi:hypothetical protein